MLRRVKQAIGRKAKEKEPTTYKRLANGLKDQESMEKCPKGYVPVLVGRDPMAVERFVVHIKLFKDPCIALLLDMAKDELGHSSQGVIWIPCDVEHFQQVVHVTPKARWLNFFSLTHFPYLWSSRQDHDPHVVSKSPFI